jgi:hypothetical protein
MQLDELDLGIIKDNLRKAAFVRVRFIVNMKYSKTFTASKPAPRCEPVR